ncbi:MAG: DUF1800 domain-containing protein [Pirellulaceae bacterium]|nr:DUF1800 domain-containing protein [Pirellulaceae bacterium]
MSLRNRQRSLVVIAVSSVVAFAPSLVVGWVDQTGTQLPMKGPGPTEWIEDLTPISPEEWSYDRAAHLLERAGFGGTPQEIQRLASMKPADAVDSLIDYDQIENTHLPPFDESGIYGIYDSLPVEAAMPSRSSGTTTLAGRIEVADGGVGGVPLRGHTIYLDVSGLGQLTTISDHFGRFRFNSVPLGSVAVHARGRHPGKTQNTSSIQKIRLTKPNDFVYLPLLLFPTPSNDDGSKHPNVYGVVNELRARHAAQSIKSGRDDLLETYRLEQWWAERMLKTSRPLEEKLLLFWHGHFATSNDKVADYRLMLQQLETIRRHAAGNFGDLLTAVSKNPAMLIYLDGNQNVKGQFNENFAREIMELFALGLDQYTEKDIKEAARAFSGWTNAGPTFLFSRDSHDPSEKRFIGRTGNYDGDDIIAIILEQPSCARFIARKLHKFFVRGEITPAHEERLAKLLRDNNYQLKPLLRTLFLSKDFYSSASMGEIIKSPVHFVVSTCRKLELEKLPTIPDFRVSTVALGQELLFPPNVSGWNGDKDGGAAWINPGMFLNRANYAHAVLFPDPVESFWPPDRTMPNIYVGGSEYTSVRAEYDYAFTRVKRIIRVPANVNLARMLTEADVKTADAAVDYFVQRFLPSVGLDASDRQRLVRFLVSEIGRGEIDFGSGEGIEQTLRQLVHLIMSMPEYSVG